MNRAFVFVLSLAVGLTAFAQVDYVAGLAKNEELAKRLGLSKLSESERAEWNRVLDAVRAVAAKSTSSASASGTHDAPHDTERSSKARQVSGASVWLSRADLNGEEIIKLRNGAIFKVSVGFVGVGFGRNVALIKEGSRWSLWIEGKREFRGELLKLPSVGSPVSFLRSSLQSVSSDGGIVRLIDGSLYEIDSINRIHTSLWLPANDVFVVNGTSLINPDDSSSELVQATRLK